MMIDDPRYFRGIVGIGCVVRLADLLHEAVRVILVLKCCFEPRPGVQEPAMIVRRRLKRAIGSEAALFGMTVSTRNLMRGEPRR